MFRHSLNPVAAASLYQRLSGFGGRLSPSGPVRVSMHLVGGKFLDKALRRPTIVQMLGIDLSL